MVFYFKSNIPAKFIQPLIHRYISMETGDYKNNLVDSYLKKNYKVGLKTVTDNINFYCKIADFKDNVLSVYWNNNISVGDSDLDTLIKLLEYGNLDIPPLQLISKSFTNIVRGIKNRLV